jgi:enterochelin esterase-like enzyme
MFKTNAGFQVSNVRAQMNSILIRNNWALGIVLFASFLAAGVRAQMPVSFSSHEVHPDGSITFRYRNTGARKVEVSVESLKTPLAMFEQNGVWTATTQPLPPETYWYWFIVDGQIQLDPLNDFVLPNYAYLNSNVTVHGLAPQLWEQTNVPHGELHHHFFKPLFENDLPGGESDYYVYTPPGYDHSHRYYPVLYLLHGYAQTAADWTVPGGANFILDQLIAQGKARPMVVVMPLCYGSIDAVSQTILSEILPQVESEYRVRKDRDDRAVAGLSMGAMESLSIAFNHPDLFAWVGSFSAGDMLHSKHPLIVDIPQNSFRLLWIACGADDSLLTSNRELIAALKAKRFPIAAIETPGGHTWMVWHNDLIRFAPLLFQ